MITQNCASSLDFVYETNQTRHRRHFYSVFNGSRTEMGIQRYAFDVRNVKILDRRRQCGDQISDWFDSVQRKKKKTENENKQKKKTVVLEVVVTE